MVDKPQFSADITTRAHQWLNYINNKYSQEIHNTINNSLVFTPKFHYEAPVRRQHIRLMNIDTVNAFFTLDGDITILNFADYKYPGGAFLDGATAQEEALCHKSILFPVLDAFDFCYYAHNRAESNQELYTNKAIFTKDVIFEQPTGEIKTANVLTCAAPNWLIAQKYYNVNKSENNKVIRERLKWMNEILAHEKVDIFIAGAWGCGVFRQDPEFMVRTMFKELTYPKDLVFAIPKGKIFEVFREFLIERYENK